MIGVYCGNVIYLIFVQWFYICFLCHKGFSCLEQLQPCLKMNCILLGAELFVSLKKMV